MKTNRIAPESYETPKVNVLVVEMNMATMLDDSNGSGETPGEEDPE